MGLELGKVAGTVVCTRKHPLLLGMKLLMVRNIVAGKPAGLTVAADSIHVSGAEDELVYMVSSTEAAASFRRGLVPVDCAIVGIVDSYNSTRYKLEKQ